MDHVHQNGTECNDTVAVETMRFGTGHSEVNCSDGLYVPTFTVGGGSWESEHASGAGSGPYDFGEGRISPEFSCGRYQIIEPAGLEQCNQMAANLVGSVKACYYDEGSDTCYAGAGPHDEATASALQIAGIVLLVTGTLPISLPLVLFTVWLCFMIVTKVCEDVFCQE